MQRGNADDRLHAVCPERVLQAKGEKRSQAAALVQFGWFFCACLRFTERMCQNKPVAWLDCAHMAHF